MERARMAEKPAGSFCREALQERQWQAGNSRRSAARSGDGLAAATRLVYARARLVGGRRERKLPGPTRPRVGGETARRGVFGQPGVPAALPEPEEAETKAHGAGQRHRLVLRLRRLG